MSLAVCFDLNQEFSKVAFYPPSYGHILQMKGDRLLKIVLLAKHLRLKGKQVLCGWGDRKS